MTKRNSGIDMLRILTGKIMRFRFFLHLKEDIGTLQVTYLFTL